MCVIPLFMYSILNPFLMREGTEPRSFDKCTIALENNAVNVGNKIIPIIVPTVDAPIKTLYCCSTNKSVFSLGAASTKLPVNGCCTMLAILEKVTIILNNDNADAISFTLAPDNLTNLTTLLSNPHAQEGFTFFLSKNEGLSVTAAYSARKEHMPVYRFLERILFPPTLFNKHKLERQLAGKTILITGASSGIGEQLAYLLADIKVHLILVARREDRLVGMKESIEMKAAQVSIYPADLRDDEDMAGLLRFLHQLPDGLDIVVSNAGHSIKRSIHQSLDRYHDFTRTMAINYSAPVQLLLSVIPLLEQKQGHIFNISTINVLLHPLPKWSAYQASKAAFHVWFQSVAPELNMIGISTTSIYLPLVRTPMILPTVAYQRLPAMSSQHVATIIGKYMYTRKKTYKPWWPIFGKVISIFSKKSFDDSETEKKER